MVVRLLAQLRAPIFVGGQVAAWVLLAVDARREWNASWFVGLLLVLGALAAIPAQVVDQPEFRVVALVTQTIGAGVVALALYDTPDKRALWAYALAALGAVALPSSRPTLGALPARRSALGRATALGVAAALLLTIGASAPAMAWGRTQPEVMVCVRPVASVDELTRDSRRFDPDHVIAGFGLDGPHSSCLEASFDPGATAGDAAEVARRYSMDPRVASVTRTR
ncbi:hypothetical protein ENC19_00535 [Verrucosispora sp. CWR15]|uniref:Uncharacterized protein n=1 Tax=Verrucosispora sioxanthis TaxID=2499994 RepID=A0A6M1L1V8_9ACTN|nr:hypothetical protein [Verrucosispora sioxanthis]NEE62160.1 hypothetical protein [Verrucosispora sioxanthis]NGM11270.1 hypothetical protein [Verrucosispora sioxanthis]